ncbi:hypothetical protein [Streptomyces minutiscleroticus]|uniref:Uncharacterized protein n=1 Tax=Streptomyces minutiscleroticus TaxID=68238 RepID=A0A918U4G0_9ACTN|nr:hypothetical protein [Streptomyces minutiscleroticus]GGX90033.1 hypothetical protein GCM10010358_50060 [Streptomyces minutiscleroticus]
MVDAVSLLDEDALPAIVRPTVADPLKVVAVAAALLETPGYRQLSAVWRLQGWWASLRGGAPCGAR